MIIRLVAIALLAQTTLAAAQQAPTREGECITTEVAALSHRLDDGKGSPVPDSGSLITYTNGLSQVSYDELPAVNRSRPGDQVRLCLVRIPRGCPPGDTRGRVYAATNLRTRAAWSLPDSQHTCGGA